eukprot:jgi/Botrbrau1/15849/Bobra.40_1s0033.1
MSGRPLSLMIALYVVGVTLQRTVGQTTASSNRRSPWVAIVQDAGNTLLNETLHTASLFTAQARSLTRSVEQSTQVGSTPRRTAAASLGPSPQPAAVPANVSEPLVLDESLLDATAPTQVELLRDLVTGTTRIVRNNGSNPIATFIPGVSAVNRALSQVAKSQQRISSRPQAGSLLQNLAVTGLCPDVVRGAEQRDRALAAALSDTAARRSTRW